MRLVIFLSLFFGAFAGYLFWFTRPVEAPPSPPPLPPTEISVGALRLTLVDWKISTTTESSRIEVSLEDPGPRRKEVLRFLERTLAGYADMVDPTAMPADELAWIRESGRPYSLVVKGSSSMGQGGRSSYRLNVSYDTGGAHPNGGTVTESYGPDGEKLALEAVAGSRNRLAEALRPRLAAQIAERIGGDSPYEPGEDFAAGTAPEVPENYASWYLSDRSIVVVVNPYQVGPYAFGSYEVFVPLEELGR